MARKEAAKKANAEQAEEAQEQRASESPDFPVWPEPGFAPMQEPNEVTAIINGTELEQARAEQAPISTEQATQQLVDTMAPTLTPAEYEAKRFEAFKLDLYRVLYKHKYTLVSNGLIGTPGVGIGVVDAGNTSRMKRQLAQAGCVESLVNLTGKVEL